MSRSCGVRGSLGQFEHPVWEPLLGVVGEHLTGTFMWMNDVRLSDGIRVHTYKHIWTRRHLYLDESGRAYEVAPCHCFVPMRLDFALEAALCNWWFLAGWDEHDAAEIKRVILEANKSVSRAA